MRRQVILRRRAAHYARRPVRPSSRTTLAEVGGKLAEVEDVHGAAPIEVARAATGPPEVAGEAAEVEDVDALILVEVPDQRAAGRRRGRDGTQRGAGHGRGACAKRVAG